jgi:hypothetical protein
MLKIEKASDGQESTFRLSGRIELEHIGELREEIERNTMVTALDLDEVRLVGRDIIQLLGDCEGQGIQLRNCPFMFASGSLKNRHNQRNVRVMRWAESLLALDQHRSELARPGLLPLEPGLINPNVSPSHKIITHSITAPRTGSLSRFCARLNSLSEPVSLSGSVGS